MNKIEKGKPTFRPEFKIGFGINHSGCKVDPEEGYYLVEQASDGQPYIEQDDEQYHYFLKCTHCRDTITMYVGHDCDARKVDYEQG